MPPSRQITTDAQLAKFAAWAIAYGFNVGENAILGTGVLTQGVHRPDSWHYLNKALDLNWPGGGAEERRKLLVAMEYAQSLGLAVVFARDGIVGVARNHQTHLHVDVGEWSNTGLGLVRARVIPLKGPLPGKLVTDGRLEKLTILEWQDQVETPEDGKISTPSLMVQKVERMLNRKNGKGGFTLKRRMPEKGIANKRFWQAVQKLLNAWIKAGKVKAQYPLRLTGKPDKRTVIVLQRSLNNNLWR